MRSILLSILFTASFSLATPLQAQECAPQGAPLRCDWRPGVRYTTGSYTVRGWEKQLVNGDPNLRHWNWSPVIGYTQSVAGTTSKQATSAVVPERPKSLYIKPNHVPLPIVVRPAAVRSTIAKTSAAKTQIAKINDFHGSDSSRTETHTQAVLSYGTNYRGADRVRAASNVYGKLAHKSVGALLSESLNY